MVEKPRPTGIVLVSAVTLVLLSLAVIAAYLVAIISPPPEWRPGAFSGMHEAVVTVACIAAVAAVLMILAESRAIWGCSLRTTTWLFRMFAYLSVLASLGWIQTAVCLIGSLTGLMPKTDVRLSAGEFAIQSVLYAWRGLTAFAHLRWWYILNAYEKIGAAVCNAEQSLAAESR
ncbi:MAG: hypothetical protein NTX58_13840 [Actinobacteria bacterium]|nr:hypothetical protein [Actinomycetota bacterium]